MYTVTVGPYVIAFQSLETEEPPLRYEWARQHAELLEEFDLQRSDGDFCYLVAGRSIDHPTLVLAQRHDPPEDAGFYPGVLVVPETDVLFVGAGERLLAYDLARPARLWEDVADVAKSPSDWTRRAPSSPCERRRRFLGSNTLRRAEVAGARGRSRRLRPRARSLDQA